MIRVVKIKFKEREQTEFISVHEVDMNGKTNDELVKEARKRGEFDVPYHYLVHDTGTIESGRDENAIGGRMFPSYDSAVFILCDLNGHDEMTDAQSSALDVLIAQLRRRFASIKGVFTIFKEA